MTEGIPLDIEKYDLNDQASDMLQDFNGQNKTPGHRLTVDFLGKALRFCFMAAWRIRQLEGRVKELEESARREESV